MKSMALSAEKLGQGASAMVSAVEALPLVCPPQEGRDRHAVRLRRQKNALFILVMWFFCPFVMR
jgi:hypothetical protein